MSSKASSSKHRDGRRDRYGREQADRAGEPQGYPYADNQYAEPGYLNSYSNDVADYTSIATDAGYEQRYEYGYDASQRPRAERDAISSRTEREKHATSKYKDKSKSERDYHKGRGIEKSRHESNEPEMFEEYQSGTYAQQGEYDDSLEQDNYSYGASMAQHYDSGYSSAPVDALAGMETLSLQTSVPQASKSKSSKTRHYENVYVYILAWEDSTISGQDRVIYELSEVFGQLYGYTLEFRVIPSGEESRERMWSSLSSSIRRQEGRDTLQILYYYGHASIKKKELYFSCRRELDKFSFSWRDFLRRPFMNTRSDTVVILECCHAGAATPPSRSLDGSSSSTKVVLASCTAKTSSSSYDYYSFASSLCTILRGCHGGRSPPSIEDLTEWTRNELQDRVGAQGSGWETAGEPHLIYLSSKRGSIDLPFRASFTEEGYESDPEPGTLGPGTEGVRDMSGVPKPLPRPKPKGR